MAKKKTFTVTQINMVIKIYAFVKQTFFQNPDRLLHIVLFKIAEFNISFITIGEILYDKQHFIIVIICYTTRNISNCSTLGRFLLFLWTRNNNNNAIKMIPKGWNIFFYHRSIFKLVPNTTRLYESICDTFDIK